MFNIPGSPSGGWCSGLERKPGDKGEKVGKPKGGAARTHSLHHERQATANCKVNRGGISLPHLGSHHYDSLRPPLELQHKTLQSYLVRESAQRLTVALMGIRRTLTEHNSQVY